MIKNSFVVGVLVASLSMGCGGSCFNNNNSNSSVSSNGSTIEYFNPNPEIIVVGAGSVENNISYDSLVDMVHASGGSIQIPVYATSVALEDHGFLNQRYALAWTTSLQGQFQDLEVVLSTTTVEREEFGILDQSYGYASERTMGGVVSGNNFSLSCTKKNVDVQGILDQKYGIAFSEEMRGSLGDDIEVILISVPGTKTGGILDQNFGYSWINSGTLTLKLRKPLKYF